MAWSSVFLCGIFETSRTNEESGKECWWRHKLFRIGWVEPCLNIVLSKYNVVNITRICHGSSSASPSYLLTYLRHPKYIFIYLVDEIFCLGLLFVTAFPNLDTPTTPSFTAMPTRLSNTRKLRGHVSHGHGRVGKHRKHPGGRGLAGGQHHHRTNFDKCELSYRIHVRGNTDLCRPSWLFWKSRNALLPWTKGTELTTDGLCS